MIVAVTAPQSPLGVDRARGRIAVCCGALVAMAQSGHDRSIGEGRICSTAGVFALSNLFPPVKLGWSGFAFGNVG